MKRLRCMKCGQVFWAEFKPKEEKAFIRGDWIQCACPKCGNTWTSVLGQRAARRARKGLRRAKGRKGVKGRVKRGKRTTRASRGVEKVETLGMGVSRIP